MIVFRQNIAYFWSIEHAGTPILLLNFSAIDEFKCWFKTWCNGSVVVFPTSRYRNDFITCLLRTSRETLALYRIIDFENAFSVWFFYIYIFWRPHITLWISISNIVMPIKNFLRWQKQPPSLDCLWESVFVVNEGKQSAIEISSLYFCKIQC
jgi:hypothetical protein